MAPKKRPVPVPTPSEEQAEAIARDLVSRKSGLAGSEFKKELPAEFKSFDRLIVDAAERLSARGQIHRWSNARKVRFFSRNPLELMPQAVQAAFESGPTTEAALTKYVGSRNRGTQDLLKEWLKSAVSRGAVFAYSPASGSKTKRYWRQPDIAALFKKVVTELRKVLDSSPGRHVTKEKALEVLAQELGIKRPTISGACADERQTFLAALTGYTQDHPKGALLSLGGLRARAGLDKQRFDAIALELQRDGLVTLHHHDFPESLTGPERSQLVVDERGTHYVGIALRSGS